MERWILHADMDAFYASVEQRDRPELRGLPVIVGATSRRGVVMAASYEARVFGVRSAMPGFRARELCPQGVYVMGDMKKYAHASSLVHDVFGEFTDDIEPIALDEAFLDITGSVKLFGGPITLARRLKERVREVTELPVSCGIAPTKLVAKIACSLSKPDGLLLVPPEAVRWLIDPLPVRRLWGVGPVLEKELLDAGFRTFADLSRDDGEPLRRVVGDRAFELARRARGEDPRDVERDRDAKSYGEESTFEHDVTDRDVVTAALTSHAEAVARRMRHDAVVGRTVTVKIKLGRAVGQRVSRSPGADTEPRYPLLSRQTTLARPTDDGQIIRAAALRLWDESGVREPVRLLGVSMSKMGARAAQQLELFAPKRERRSAKLGPALDAIRERFGDGAIRRAVDAPGKITPSGRKKRGE